MDPDWVAPAVLDVITQASGRSSRGAARAARGGADPPRARAGAIAARARRRARARRSSPRCSARRAPRRSRRCAQAADGLRARTRGGDRQLRRQPEHQRLEHLHGRVRVLRLRPGPALAGRLRARRGRASRASRGGGRVRRDRDLHAVGIHPDWSSRTTGGWLRLAKDAAPQLHLHAYSPMEVAHMGTRACRRAKCSRSCATPASARRRAPPPRCSTTACASASRRTSSRRRAGWRSSRPAHAAGLRSTSTVMFGHIEEPWELAEHMRVIRDAAGAHGRDHRVRAAVVHPVPDAARPHARDRGDLARGEPQAHGGLPARARPHDPERPGELGEDGARRRHRGAALGRQRPRRHADGGVDLPHGGLTARRPARAGGPDRRGARAGRPAAERTRCTSAARVPGARGRGGLGTRARPSPSEGWPIGPDLLGLLVGEDVVDRPAHVPGQGRAELGVVREIGVVARGHEAGEEALAEVAHVPVAAVHREHAGLVAHRSGVLRRAAQDLAPVGREMGHVLGVEVAVRERVVQLGVGEAAGCDAPRPAPAARARHRRTRRGWAASGRA